MWAALRTCVVIAYVRLQNRHAAVTSIPTKSLCVAVALRIHLSWLGVPHPAVLILRSTLSIVLCLKLSVSSFSILKLLVVVVIVWIVTVIYPEKSLLHMMAKLVEAWMSSASLVELFCSGSAKAINAFHPSGVGELVGVHGKDNHWLFHRLANASHSLPRLDKHWKCLRCLVKEERMAHSKQWLIGASFCPC